MERTEAQISDRVRSLLASREISESELARRLGWKQPYVSRRIRGVVPWRVDDIARIAEHLEVDFAQLITGDTTASVTQ